MADFDFEHAKQVQTEIQSNWGRIKEYEHEGDAAYERGAYGSAVKAYSRALQYFPSQELIQIAYPTRPNNVWLTFLTVIYNRGLAYCNSGNYRAAIDDFNLVLRELPMHFDAMYHRGLAKRNLGDLRAAIADFNEILENKEDAYAYNERGIAYAELGKMTEAVTDFRSALRIDPTHTPAMNNLRRIGNSV